MESRQKQVKQQHQKLASLSCSAAAWRHQNREIIHVLLLFTANGHRSQAWEMCAGSSWCWSFFFFFLLSRLGRMGRSQGSGQRDIGQQRGSLILLALSRICSLAAGDEARVKSYVCSFISKQAENSITFSSKQANGRSTHLCLTLSHVICRCILLHGCRPLLLWCLPNTSQKSCVRSI